MSQIPRFGSWPFTLLKIHIPGLCLRPVESVPQKIFIILQVWELLLETRGRNDDDTLIGIAKASQLIPAVLGGREERERERWGNKYFLCYLNFVGSLCFFSSCSQTCVINQAFPVLLCPSSEENHWAHSEIIFWEFWLIVLGLDGFQWLLESFFPFHL